MFSSPVRLFYVILTAAALTGCGSPSEISRSATVLQVPQAQSLSVVARQFQNDVATTIHFDFDEDQLDAEAMARLDAQASWIIVNSHVKFRVYGHADRVGSTDYNADLGLRRATNAVAYLVGKGIAQERLEAMVSFGEDAPVLETENRERANRRVVTEVFGFVDLPPARVARNDIAAISVGGPVSTDNLGQTSGPGEEGPTPSSDPEPETEPKGKSKKPNSGRGNGDEDGDPGHSEGRNNGGDEVDT